MLKLTLIKDARNYARQIIINHKNNPIPVQSPKLQSQHQAPWPRLAFH